LKFGTLVGIYAYLFPNWVFSGVGCGGNLPLGDLVGKGELAQGSSNGLRTIHDLV